ncbi:MAG TPA: TraR/DksA family transcriptional regulator, partial [Candidatus Binataceae bacterium]|nr:TraR/DksA family transcriptional regulator [Candidatus Binataceae bacterium]
RIKELRRDQEQDAETSPADEMDLARSTSDTEMHAGLTAREEEKLRFIDEAFSRLETGKYGICLGCRGTIPVERLAAIPFAAYCVDCQEDRNRARRNWGEGTMIEPYDHQWTVPEEAEEPTEREYRQQTGPEEEVSVHFNKPLGPEEAQEVAPSRKRGRPASRKKPRSR